MKRLLLILLLLVYAQSFAVTDQFGIERQVRCPEEGISVAYYQFGGFHEDGVGLDVDIIGELKKRTRCRFNTTLLTRAEIWKNLENGSLMLATSGTPTLERERIAYFIPYSYQKNILLLHESVPPRINSIQEFAKSSLKFGMVKSFTHGAYYDPYVQEMENQRRVIYVEDSPMLFRGLKAHQYDGVLAFPINYSKSLVQYDLRNNVRVGSWVSQERAMPLGLIFSKKYFTEEDVKAWAAQVYQMKKDGTLLGFTKRYMKAYDAEKSVGD